MRSTTRLARVLAVPAVVGAAALAAGGVTGGAAPAVAPVDKSAWEAQVEYYYNPVAPRVDAAQGDERFVGKGGVSAAARSRNPAAVALERRHKGGFPPAAKELARMEAKAIAAGGANPADFKRADSTQVARLLTVLVEFDPNANDDFSGYNRLASGEVDEEECVVEPEGTLLGGPLHNEMPNPATIGTRRDNNTFWVPDFSADHYDRLMFSEEGVQQRVRPDLKGPDGKAGVDIRGLTVRNMYDEMSKGAYTLTGSVQGWVQVDHSEAWYGATPCGGPAQNDIGHPLNERGAGQLAIDAVAALAEQQPDFPWSDYDIEDQGDIDGDGNLNEPDGAIDHFVLIHAGSDHADDGGAQGPYAIWSHSSTVDPSTGGYTVPGTGVRVFNYIVQAEDAGVGVIAHEYGHDLGLPDLYDIVNGDFDTDVAFWDLMSTGSHSGPLFQTMPAHMGAWSKWALGWIDPEVVEPGDATRSIRVGQASRTPVGTEDAIRVNLPPKDVQLAEPHSGENMWWSNRDQDWADARLAHSFTVPAGADVRFAWWNDYTIENLWDYGFLEVSGDAGATWTQLEIRNEAGEVVSTNADPYGRLADYGNLRNGLTGTSDGWQNYHVSLTPYVGQNVTVRFRYATDEAFVERGWFVDDVSLTADGTVVFADDFETGTDGWTAEAGSFAGTTGAGWILTGGDFSFPHYYLAEWRNADGFDRGLLYPYDTSFFNNGEWRIERNPYNVPGMLVWYRDQQYTVQDTITPLFDPPSIGTKSSVLLVDSHPRPLRRRGAAAEADPTALNTLGNRVQASNAAFGFRRTNRFRECIEVTAGSGQLTCNTHGSRRAVRTFTDRLGWYPGFEYRPDLDAEDPLYFRDVDASVVVPSRGNQIYSTRITDAEGRLLPELFGTDLGGGHVLGTGNPKDGNPLTGAGDVSLGVELKPLRAGKGNRWVDIRVHSAHAD